MTKTKIKTGRKRMTAMQSKKQTALIDQMIIGTLEGSLVISLALVFFLLPIVSIRMQIEQISRMTARVAASVNFYSPMVAQAKTETPITPDSASLPESAPVPAVTVSFDKPLDGSVVSGSQLVSVQAASDSEKTKIEAYFDDKLITASEVSPLSFSWNTKKATPGVHQWKAVAIDANGNIATTSISVTVGVPSKVN